MPYAKNDKLSEASQNLNLLRYSTKYIQDEHKKNQKSLSHPQWHVQFTFSNDPSLEIAAKEDPTRHLWTVNKGQYTTVLPVNVRVHRNKITTPRYNCRTQKV